jgi:hypothetical protein
VFRHFAARLGARFRIAVRNTASSRHARERIALRKSVSLSGRALLVIPAQAGTQVFQMVAARLGARFRGHDEKKRYFAVQSESGHLDKGKSL